MPIVKWPRSMAGGHIEWWTCTRLNHVREEWGKPLWFLKWTCSASRDTSGKKVVFLKSLSPNPRCHMFQYVKSITRGVGDGWSESPRFTCSVLHNCIMSGERCHITNSKDNHLKWINRAWQTNVFVCKYVCDSWLGLYKYQFSSMEASSYP